MKLLPLIISLLSIAPVFAQNVDAKLSAAVTSLEKDDQFKHAIISMYVVDGKTGNIVYEKNAQTGMAPASCQKVITSTTAFELLGKDYTYKTFIGCEGKIKDNNLNGDLIFTGNGDPTLGSWRWKQTVPEIVFNKINAVLFKNKIEGIEGDIYVGGRKFSYNPVPDGWIWQDIGNYYGAGAWGFNWHENQYDLKLKSTNNIDYGTSIVSTEPADLKNNITNLVTSAKKGSGDNVYIYATPYNDKIFAEGTIPVGENSFKVSGSIPNPLLEFGKKMIAFLKDSSIKFSGKLITDIFSAKNKLSQERILDSIVSPSFDSINYWFLKRSINLYGEAFVKTIAVENNKQGSTDSGIAIIRDFWSKRGIDKAALKIIDGSGLSPANRVTTNALVTVLQYAKKQSWFYSFYFDLPEINNIKMKDGYINGVRSYSGFVKSKDGKEYTFSFIVNNFDGNPGTVREKMWKVLDLLK
jgi:D-alanyl-D-alanine carboxypeptidase/D-alanyl-D-alanine-endopeptidase (penicillin-binding protein 4)